MADAKPKEETKTEVPKTEPAVEEQTNTATTAVVSVEGPKVPDVQREKTLEEIMAEDAGHGSEFIGLRERQIPFISTLQNSSPQVVKGGPEYIKGAESSMFMNTLNKDVYPANVAEPEKGGGILVIPVHFKTKAIEWVKRSEGGGGGGGGLVRVWGDDESFKTNGQFVLDAKKNRWGNPANNSEVSDHYDTYVIVVGFFGPPTEEEPMGKVTLIDPVQAVLSCKGMQIKKARAWNSERMSRRMVIQGRSLQAPAWYDAWRIRTKYEQNDQGNWFGLVIDRYKTVTEMPGGGDLYMQARSMYQDVQQGLLKTDENALSSTEGSAFVDEEVPF